MQRLCLLFTLFIILTGCSAPQQVEFPDPNLEEAIRSRLGFNADKQIHADDLKKINKLYASSSAISNISGLEKLTNLTELSLYNNKVSDLTPLSGLQNLRILELGNNQISDLNPLSELTNLNQLFSST